MYGGVNSRDGKGRLAMRRMKESRSWVRKDAFEVDRATYARREDGGDAMNGFGLIKME
jgi:hypothetical protein